MFQFGVAPGKYWLFGLLAFLAWTVGGYADGANALELFGVPVLIGLWICAVVMIDALIKTDEHEDPLFGAREKPEAPLHWPVLPGGLALKSSGNRAKLTAIRRASSRASILARWAIAGSERK